jgi:RimJ/RimL family protein N-acetyltransferase
MPEGWPGTEIGWVYARSAWGKGYATEAASAAIDWAFDELGWSNIIHCIRPDNVNSSAVARRLGSSRLRSQMLPAPLDEIRHDIYGQSREQWNARRSVSAVEA